MSTDERSAMERPVLMLLPGLLCDEAVWQNQLEFLDGVRCIVPSFGSRSSLAAMAEHVLANAPVGRFALAGHSMGARVALEVMRMAPQRIERLALADTGTQALPSGEAGERERRQRFALLELARRSGMREMGLQWAPGMVHPDRVGTEVFESILAMIERSTPEMFEAQIHALLERPDAADVLAAVHCPTLLICGRQDAWSPLARHEAMQATLPGSQLVVIEDAGHMTTMEQPVAVSIAMKEWLHDR